MKWKLARLTKRYITALRRHLKEAPEASLNAARLLGREAVSLGLETLEMAGIHREAIRGLGEGIGTEGTKRADLFFTEAITPIEKTHRASIQDAERLDRLKERLSRRTADLAASNLSLQEGIGERKAMEEILKKRREHSARLLKESMGLQRHLQDLTRKILVAQEGKRKEISHKLHNEIAQILLGVNVRLLALKKEAMDNAKGLQKEIGVTQRLVEASMRSIERFTREFGK